MVPEKKEALNPRKRTPPRGNQEHREKKAFGQEKSRSEPEQGNQLFSVGGHTFPPQKGGGKQPKGPQKKSPGPPSIFTGGKGGTSLSKKEVRS